MSALTASITSVRKPSLVGQRRALVVDAAVDAAAQMLDEAAEDAPVDATDLAVHVNADLSQGQAPFDAAARIRPLLPDSALSASPDSGSANAASA